MLNNVFFAILGLKKQHFENPRQQFFGGLNVLPFAAYANWFIIRRSAMDRTFFHFRQKTEKNDVTNTSFS